MIAIIADVHGNYPALLAVLKNIKKYNVEKIYSLGDLCGYYSMINEVINTVREKGIINILGNHDYYITDNKNCPRSKSANICLEYQRNVITNENLEWLKNSKNNLIINDLNMVHGGWIDNLDEYIYEVNEDYFSNIDGKYFFSGHTHVQKIIKFNNKIYCNPGSVGQPRDGNWKAAYSLLDNNKSKIILKRVEYDVDLIAFDMKNKGFDQHYYSNLYKGARIGGIIDDK
ncbi:MAG: metallophosphoesterase family protein [Chloroflexi bacterium]|nr:metallophosphoesterase family protein [Chloroflexota bacterium]